MPGDDCAGGRRKAVRRFEAVDEKARENSGQRMIAPDPCAGNEVRARDTGVDPFARQLHAELAESLLAAKLELAQRVEKENVAAR